MKILFLVVALLGATFARNVVKRQILAPVPPPPAPLPPPTLPPLLTPPPPQPSLHRTQPQIHTYSLPSGAELIIGDIKSTFSCIDKIYGYYADTDNNCQIFHVCVPYVDEFDQQQPEVFNFFCGNLTVFDQANLVCTHPQDATPCSEAPTFYSVNENFGRTDRPLVRGV